MDQPVLKPPQAAYVHVPFCRHRCGYCDFPLITGRDDLIGDFLRALELELQTLGTPQEMQTLFFGGGTPTHLAPPALERLFELTHHWLPLAPGGELSVEVNPNDLDDDRIGVLVAAGVTRVSLGVQSFDPAGLAVLERDHSPEDVLEGLSRLRAAGLENVSLDLIFGVPGQSVAQWQDMLTSVEQLDIQHVSTYGLTYEKGTAFWRRRSLGTLRPADEEAERAMYALAMDRLPAAGFPQYEISNFARPGFECRHNQVYWRGESYFAFGPGAARYVEGVRSTNHRSVTSWLNRVLGGGSAVAETETLDDEGRARELIMLGLRMTEGIDLPAFLERTGYDVRELEPVAIARFCADGLLEEAHGHLRLTRAGRFLADTVIAELL